MKNWFKSLNKTLRGVICISPLAVGGALILLYAWFEKLFLLLLGIGFVVVSILFLALNGKVVTEEKFQMTPEQEAEHQRRMEESERRGEADAASIQDADLDSAIHELQKLSDQKEIDYNRTTDAESRMAAGYDLMYTNAKLRTVIKRKMKILRPDSQPLSGSPSNGINVEIMRDIELPLNTKAVGVTFDNCQDHIKESMDEDALLIIHTPTAQFPNSIDIINVRTNKSLGHVKSNLAEQLIDTFGQKFILNGKIIAITGGTPERPIRGCNIQILSVSEKQNK